MITHISTIDSLYIIYKDFKYDIIRAGSVGSYRENLGISSKFLRLKSKCGTQFIEVTGIVQRAPTYQNLYRGKLSGKLGVLSCIHSLEYITGSVFLVMKCCNNVSELRILNIHPE